MNDSSTHFRQRSGTKTPQDNLGPSSWRPRTSTARGIEGQSSVLKNRLYTSSGTRLRTGRSGSARLIPVNFILEQTRAKSYTNRHKHHKESEPTTSAASNDTTRLTDKTRMNMDDFLMGLVASQAKGEDKQYNQRSRTPGYTRIDNIVEEIQRPPAIGYFSSGSKNLMTKIKMDRPKSQTNLKSTISPSVSRVARQSLVQKPPTNMPDVITGPKNFATRTIMQLETTKHNADAIKSLSAQVGTMVLEDLDVTQTPGTIKNIDAFHSTLYKSLVIKKKALTPVLRKSKSQLSQQQPVIRRPLTATGNLPSKTPKLSVTTDMDSANIEKGTTFVTSGAQTLNSIQVKEENETNLQQTSLEILDQSLEQPLSSLKQAKPQRTSKLMQQQMADEQKEIEQMMMEPKIPEPNLTDAINFFVKELHNDGILKAELLIPLYRPDLLERVLKYEHENRKLVAYLDKLQARMVELTTLDKNGNDALYKTKLEQLKEDLQPPDLQLLKEMTEEEEMEYNTTLENYKKLLHLMYKNGAPKEPLPIPLRYVYLTYYIPTQEFRECIKNAKVLDFSQAFAIVNEKNKINGRQDLVTFNKYITQEEQDKMLMEILIYPWKSFYDLCVVPFEFVAKLQSFGELTPKQRLQRSLENRGSDNEPQKGMISEFYIHMSTRGIAFIKNKLTVRTEENDISTISQNDTLTDFDHFVTERNMYFKLRTLRLFQYFRQRKYIRLWRSALRTYKYTQAIHEISTRVFTVYPTFKPVTITIVEIIDTMMDNINFDVLWANLNDAKTQLKIQQQPISKDPLYLCYHVYSLREIVEICRKRLVSIKRDVLSAFKEVAIILFGVCQSITKQSNSASIDDTKIDTNILDSKEPEDVEERVVYNDLYGINSTKGNVIQTRLKRILIQQQLPIQRKSLQSKINTAFKIKRHDEEIESRQIAKTIIKSIEMNQKSAAENKLYKTFQTKKYEKYRLIMFLNFIDTLVTSRLYFKCFSLLDEFIRRVAGYKSINDPNLPMTLVGTEQTYQLAHYYSEFMPELERFVRKKYKINNLFVPEPPEATVPISEPKYPLYDLLPQPLSKIALVDSSTEEFTELCATAKIVERKNTLHDELQPKKDTSELDTNNTILFRSLQKLCDDRKNVETELQQKLRLQLTSTKQSIPETTKELPPNTLFSLITNKPIEMFFDNEFNPHPYTGVNLYKMTKREPVYPLIQLTITLSEDEQLGETIGCLKILPSFASIKNTFMDIVLETINTIDSTPKITHFPQLHSFLTDVKTKNVVVIKAPTYSNPILKQLLDDSRTQIMLKSLKIALKRNFNKVEELISGVTPFLRNLFGSSSIFLQVKQACSRLNSIKIQNETEFTVALNYIRIYDNKTELICHLEELKAIPDKYALTPDDPDLANLKEVIGIYRQNASSSFKDDTKSRKIQELIESIEPLPNTVEPIDTIAECHTMPICDCLIINLDVIKNIISVLHETITELNKLPWVKSVGIFTVNTYEVYDRILPLVKASIHALITHIREYATAVSGTVLAIIKMAIAMKLVDLKEYISKAVAVGRKELIQKVIMFIEFYDKLVKNSEYVISLIKLLKVLAEVIESEGFEMEPIFYRHMNCIKDEYTTYQDTINDYDKKKKAVQALSMDLVMAELDSIRSSIEHILKATLSKDYAIAQIQNHVASKMTQGSSPSFVDQFDINEDDLSCDNLMENYNKLASKYAEFQKYVIPFDRLRSESFNNFCLMSSLVYYDDLHNTQDLYESTRELLKKIEFITMSLKGEKYDGLFKVLDLIDVLISNRLHLLQAIREYTDVTWLIRTAKVKEQRDLIDTILSKISTLVEVLYSINEELTNELYSVVKIDTYMKDFNAFVNAASQTINSVFNRKDYNKVEAQLKASDKLVYYYNSTDVMIQHLTSIKDNIILIKDVNECNSLVLYRIAYKLNERYQQTQMGKGLQQEDPGVTSWASSEWENFKSKVIRKSFSHQNILFKKPQMKQVDDQDQKPQAMSKKLLYNVASKVNFDFSRLYIGYEAPQVEASEETCLLKLVENNLTKFFSFNLSPLYFLTNNAGQVFASTFKNLLNQVGSSEDDAVPKVTFTEEMLLNLIIVLPPPFCYLGELYFDFIESRRCNSNVKFAEFELKNITQRLHKCISDNISAYYLYFAESLNIDVSQINDIINYDIASIRKSVYKEIRDYQTDVQIYTSIKSTRKNLKNVTVNPVNITVLNIIRSLNNNKLQQELTDSFANLPNKFKSDINSLMFVHDKQYPELKNISNVLMIENIRNIIRTFNGIEIDLNSLNSKNKRQMTLLRTVVQRNRKDTKETHTAIYKKVADCCYSQLQSEYLYHSYLCTNTILYDMNIQYLRSISKMVIRASELLNSIQDRYCDIIGILGISDVRHKFLGMLNATQKKLTGADGKQLNQIKPPLGHNGLYNISTLSAYYIFINLFVKISTLISRLVDVKAMFKISICDENSKIKSFNLLKIYGFFSSQGQDSNQYQDQNTQRDQALGQDNVSTMNVFDDETIPTVKSNMSQEVVATLVSYYNQINDYHQQLLLIVLEKRQVIPRLFLLSDQEVIYLLSTRKTLNKPQFATFNNLINRMYPSLRGVTCIKQEIADLTSVPNLLPILASFLTEYYNFDYIYGYKSLDKERLTFGMFERFNPNNTNERITKVLQQSYKSNVFTRENKPISLQVLPSRGNEDSIETKLIDFENSFKTTTFNNIVCCYNDLTFASSVNAIKIEFHHAKKQIQSVPEMKTRGKQTKKGGYLKSKYQYICKLMHNVFTIDKYYPEGTEAAKKLGIVQSESSKFLKAISKPLLFINRYPLQSLMIARNIEFTIEMSSIIKALYYKVDPVVAAAVTQNICDNLLIATNDEVQKIQKSDEPEINPQIPMLKEILGIPFVNPSDKIVKQAILNELRNIKYKQTVIIDKLLLVRSYLMGTEKIIPDLTVLLVEELNHITNRVNENKLEIHDMPKTVSINYVNKYFTKEQKLKLIEKALILKKTEKLILQEAFYKNLIIDMIQTIKYHLSVVFANEAQPDQSHSCTKFSNPAFSNFEKQQFYTMDSRTCLLMKESPFELFEMMPKYVFNQGMTNLFVFTNNLLVPLRSHTDINNPINRSPNKSLNSTRNGKINSYSQTEMTTSYSVEDPSYADKNKVQRKDGYNLQKGEVQEMQVGKPGYYGSPDYNLDSISVTTSTSPIKFSNEFYSLSQIIPFTSKRMMLSVSRILSNMMDERSSRLLSKSYFQDGNMSLNMLTILSSLLGRLNTTYNFNTILDRPLSESLNEMNVVLMRLLNGLALNDSFLILRNIHVLPPELREYISSIILTFTEHININSQPHSHEDYDSVYKSNARELFTSKYENVRTPLSFISLKLPFESIPVIDDKLYPNPNAFIFITVSPVEPDQGKMRILELTHIYSVEQSLYDHLYYTFYVSFAQYDSLLTGKYVTANAFTVSSALSKSFSSADKYSSLPLADDSLDDLCGHLVLEGSQTHPITYFLCCFVFKLFQIIKSHFESELPASYFNLKLLQRLESRLMELHQTHSTFVAYLFSQMPNIKLIQLFYVALVIETFDNVFMSLFSSKQYLRYDALIAHYGLIRNNPVLRYLEGPPVVKKGLDIVKLLFTLHRKLHTLMFFAKCDMKLSLSTLQNAILFYKPSEYPVSHKFEELNAIDMIFRTIHKKRQFSSWPWRLFCNVCKMLLTTVFFSSGQSKYLPGALRNFSLNKYVLFDSPNNQTVSESFNSVCRRVSSTVRDNRCCILIGQFKTSITTLVLGLFAFAQRKVRVIPGNVIKMFSASELFGKWEEYKGANGFEATPTLEHLLSFYRLFSSKSFNLHTTHRGATVRQGVVKTLLRGNVQVASRQDLGTTTLRIPKGTFLRVPKEKAASECSVKKWQYGALKTLLKQDNMSKLKQKENNENVDWYSQFDDILGVLQSVGEGDLTVIVDSMINGTLPTYAKELLDSDNIFLDNCEQLSISQSPIHIILEAETTENMTPADASNVRIIYTFPEREHTTCLDSLYAPIPCNLMDSGVAIPGNYKDSLKSSSKCICNSNSGLILHRLYKTLILKVFSNSYSQSLEKHPQLLETCAAGGYKTGYSVVRELFIRCLNFTFQLFTDMFNMLYVVLEAVCNDKSGLLHEKKKETEEEEKIYSVIECPNIVPVHINKQKLDKARNVLFCNNEHYMDKICELYGVRHLESLERQVINRFDFLFTSMFLKDEGIINFIKCQKSRISITEYNVELSLNDAIWVVDMYSVFAAIHAMSECLATSNASLNNILKSAFNRVLIYGDKYTKITGIISSHIQEDEYYLRSLYPRQEVTEQKILSPRQKRDYFKYIIDPSTQERKITSIDYYYNKKVFGMDNKLYKLLWPGETYALFQLSHSLDINVSTHFVIKDRQLLGLNNTSRFKTMVQRYTKYYLHAQLADKLKTDFTLNSRGLAKNQSERMIGHYEDECDSIITFDCQTFKEPYDIFKAVLDRMEVITFIPGKLKLGRPRHNNLCPTCKTIFKNKDNKRVLTFIFTYIGGVLPLEFKQALAALSRGLILYRTTSEESSGKQSTGSVKMNIIQKMLSSTATDIKSTTDIVQNKTISNVTDVEEFEYVVLKNINIVVITSVSSQIDNFLTINVHDYFRIDKFLHSVSSDALLSKYMDSFIVASTKRSPFRSSQGVLLQTLQDITSDLFKLSNKHERRILIKAILSALKHLHNISKTYLVPQKDPEIMLLNYIVDELITSIYQNGDPNSSKEQLDKYLSLIPALNTSRVICHIDHIKNTIENVAYSPAEMNAVDNNKMAPLFDYICKALETNTPLLQLPTNDLIFNSIFFNTEEVLLYNKIINIIIEKMQYNMSFKRYLMGDCNRIYACGFTPVDFSYRISVVFYLSDNDIATRFLPFITNQIVNSYVSSGFAKVARMFNDDRDEKHEELSSLKYINYRTYELQPVIHDKGTEDANTYVYSKWQELMMKLFMDLSTMPVKISLNTLLQKASNNNIGSKCTTQLIPDSPLSARDAESSPTKAIPSLELNFIKQGMEQPYQSSLFQKLKRLRQKGKDQLTAAPSLFNTGQINVASTLIVVFINQYVQTCPVLNDLHNILINKIVPKDMFVGKNEKLVYIVENIKKSEAVFQHYLNHETNANISTSQKNELPKPLLLNTDECLQILARRVNNYVLFVMSRSVSDPVLNSRLFSKLIKTRRTSIVLSNNNLKWDSRSLFLESFSNIMLRVKQNNINMWDSKLAEFEKEHDKFVGIVKELDMSAVFNSIQDTLDALLIRDDWDEHLINMAKFNHLFADKFIFEQTRMLDEIRLLLLVRQGITESLNKMTETAVTKEELSQKLTHQRESMECHILQKSDKSKALASVNGKLRQAEEELKTRNEELATITSKLKEGTNTLKITLSDINLIVASISPEMLESISGKRRLLLNKSFYYMVYCVLVLLNINDFDDSELDLESSMFEDELDEAEDVGAVHLSPTSHVSFSATSHTPYETITFMYRVLLDPSFCQILRNMDIDTISQEAIGFVKHTYVQLQIDKATFEGVLPVLGELYSWCSLICNYNDTKSEIKDARLKVRELRFSLSHWTKELEEATAQKQELEGEVADLTNLICEDNGVINAHKKEIENIDKYASQTENLTKKFKKALDNISKELKTLKKELKQKKIIKKCTIYSIIVLSSILPESLYRKHHVENAIYRLTGKKTKDIWKEVKKYITKETVLSLKTQFVDLSANKSATYWHFLASIFNQYPIINQNKEYANMMLKQIKNKIPMTITDMDKIYKQEIETLEEFYMNTTDKLNVIKNVDLSTFDSRTYIEDVTSYCILKTPVHSITTLMFNNNNVPPMYTETSLHNKGLLYIVSNFDKANLLTGSNQAPASVLITKKETYTTASVRDIKTLITNVLLSTFIQTGETFKQYSDDWTNNDPKDKRLDIIHEQRYYAILKFKLYQFQRATKRQMAQLSKDVDVFDEDAFLHDYEILTTQTKKLKNEIKAHMHIKKHLGKYKKFTENLAKRLAVIFLTINNIDCRTYPYDEPEDDGPALHNTSDCNNALVMSFQTYKRILLQFCTNKLSVHSSYEADDAKFKSLKDERASNKAIIRTCINNAIRYFTTIYGNKMTDLLISYDLLLVAERHLYEDIYVTAIIEAINETANNWRNPELCLNDLTANILLLHANFTCENSVFISTQLLGSENTTQMNLLNEHLAKTKLLLRAYNRLLQKHHVLNSSLNSTILGLIVKISIVIVEMQLNMTIKSSTLLDWVDDEKRITVQQLLWLILMYGKLVVKVLSGCSLASSDNDTSRIMRVSYISNMEDEKTFPYDQNFSYNECSPLSIDLNKMYSDFVSLCFHSGRICDFQCMDERVLAIKSGRMKEKPDNALRTAISMIESLIPDFIGASKLAEEVLLENKMEFSSANVMTTLVSYSDREPVVSSRYLLNRSLKNLALKKGVEPSSQLHIATIMELLFNRITPRLMSLSSQMNIDSVAQKLRFASLEKNFTIIEGILDKDEIAEPVDKYLLMLNKSNAAFPHLKMVLPKLDSYFTLQDLALLSSEVIKDVCDRVCGECSSIGLNDNQFDAMLTAYKLNSSLKQTLQTVTVGVRHCISTRMLLMLFGAPCSCVFVSCYFTLLYFHLYISKLYDTSIDMFISALTDLVLLAVHHVIEKHLDTTSLDEYLFQTVTTAHANENRIQTNFFWCSFLMNTSVKLQNVDNKGKAEPNLFGIVQISYTEFLTIVRRHYDVFYIKGKDVEGNTLFALIYGTLSLCIGPRSRQMVHTIKSLNKLYIEAQQEVKSILDSDSCRPKSPEYDALTISETSTMSLEDSRRIPMADTSRLRQKKQKSLLNVKTWSTFGFTPKNQLEHNMMSMDGLIDMILVINKDSDRKTHSTTVFGDLIHCLSTKQASQDDAPLTCSAEDHKLISMPTRKPLSPPDKSILMMCLYDQYKKIRAVLSNQQIESGSRLLLETEKALYNALATESETDGFINGKPFEIKSTSLLNYEEIINRAQMDVLRLMDYEKDKREIRTSMTLITTIDGESLLTQEGTANILFRKMTLHNAVLSQVRQESAGSAKASRLKKSQKASFTMSPHPVSTIYQITPSQDASQELYGLLVTISLQEQAPQTNDEIPLLGRDGDILLSIPVTITGQRNCIMPHHVYLSPAF